MELNKAWVGALAALVAVACTKTVKLEEPSPVLVTARAPEPEPPPEPPPPERVEVQKERIQVNETIHFEFNSDEIRSESFDLMAEIARVINEHPELKKIRIEGHTDNVGSARFNLGLSQRRARSVMSHLVNEGKVDEARLEMAGYGFDRPIDTNETDEGRAKNRRVEFVILERVDDEDGEAEDETAAAPDEGDDTDEGGAE